MARALAKDQLMQRSACNEQGPTPPTLRKHGRGPKSQLKPAVQRPVFGSVCPARTRRATFLLTIPTSAPDLPSHGEAPQVDHIALHTFPTKHIA